MPEPPNLWQENEVRIKRVTRRLSKSWKRLIGVLRSDRTFSYQAPQDLRHFKVQQMWRMRRFVPRVNSILDLLTRSGL
jgi:hypothetical protein